MIVETFSWRYLKEKNQLFLNCEFSKAYTSSPKMAQLVKIASNRITLFDIFSNLRICGCDLVRHFPTC